MDFISKTREIVFNKAEREGLQFVLDHISHSLIPSSLINKIDYLFLSRGIEEFLNLTAEEIYAIRRMVPVDLLIGRKPVGETIRKKMIEASLSFEFDFAGLQKRFDNEFKEYIISKDIE